MDTVHQGIFVHIISHYQAVQTHLHLVVSHILGNVQHTGGNRVAR